MATHAIISTIPQATLTTIPIEVLYQITYHLTTPEFGNLRLTCKTVETSLVESFTREYFTKRQFMLTTFSLQAFLDISRSRFAYSLSHIILSSEQPSTNAASQMPSIIDPQTGYMHLVDGFRLHQECVDHMVLLNSGQDIEMLAEAFSNLSNLQTVGLRDFYSRSRRRDFPHTEWRSYGVKTFEITTGTKLEMQTRARFPQPPGIDHYIERMFLDVLRALGKATSRPKHFEVILRQRYLDDFAFTLPEHVLPTVQSALLDLGTVFLDLLPDSYPTAVIEDGRQIPCPNYRLRLFLTRLPHLEHLRLNFHTRHASKDVENDFLHWLAKPTLAVAPTTATITSLPTAPPAITFTNLKQLDIGEVTAEPHTLLAIIKKYQATLRGISFHKVTLRLRRAVTHKVTPNTADDDNEPKPNYWATFFSQLSRLEKLELSGMTLSFLSVEEESLSHNCLFRDSGGRGSSVRHWAGNNIQSGLRDLAALVYVNRPKPKSVASAESGEDGDEDEDDEDEDEDDVEEHGSDDDGDVEHVAGDEQ